MFSRALNVRRLRLGLWLATLGVAALAGMKLLNIVDARKAGLYTPKPRGFFDNIIASAADTGGDVEKFEPQKPTHYTRMWDSPINGFVKAPEPETRPEDEVVEKVPDLEPIDDIVILKTFTYSPDPAGGVAVVEYKDDIKIVSKSQEVLKVGYPLKHPYDEEPFLATVTGIRPDGVVVSWGGEDQLLTTKRHGESEPSPPDDEDGPKEQSLSAREQELLDQYGGKDETIKLSELSDDAYMIGKKDRERFAADSENLHQYIGVRTQDAPSGGGQEVVLANVRSDVGRTYGVQSGDVLVSINGVEMSSKSQAYNYVRNNPDLPKYVVVIRRTGKEITRTIYVPRDND